MKTNLKGVSVSINGITGEFIPYCNFNIIDKFITYLKKNNKLNDFSHKDLTNFLAELEEV